MAAYLRSLAAFWLVANVFGFAHERFVAVETGGVLSPRYYPISPGRPLWKRQGASFCEDANSHPCDEIGQPGAGICCPNDQYCIVDPGDPTRGACCFLGSDCGSPCGTSRYECSSTTTITGGGITTTSIVHECCARGCTNPALFRCPQDLGGGCCSWGESCGTGGQCLSPVTSSPSPLRTPAPAGCTTGQISCPASLRGGCCATTQSCTLVDDQPHCADITHAPTGSGVGVISGDNGLSPGAKGGIAVGVVVGCGLIFGALTWWFVRRRRERRSEGGSSSHRPRPTGVIGRVVGGGGVGGGREMTEDGSDMLSRSGGRVAGGGTQDYFGPEPAIGPYSETHTTSPMTTPGLERERGGVPVQPLEPDDIAVPVEIDSRMAGRPEMARAPATSTSGAAISDLHSRDAGNERYELYGSDPSPSPYLSSPSP